jgi:precorrin-6B methylase 2
VRPGDVVVDLGAGTGVLGILAARAGAAKVYALEATSFGAVARQIIKDNGMADRIVTVRGESRLIQLAERADVVVGDQIDGFVVDAGLVESFADAASHLLAPGGSLIPSSITWQVAPVRAPELREHLDFWREHRSPVDVTGVASLVANARRYGSVEPSQILAPACQSDPMALGGIPATVVVEGSTTVTVAGQVDALAGWARAQLSPAVHLTNHPAAPDRIDRPVALLPLTRPLAVEPGDVLRLSVAARPPTGRISWRAVAREENRAQDTFLGEVLGHEELERLDPDYRPVLTTAGRLRQRGYELCDGGHSRVEIERILRSEFDRQLPTPASLSEFMTTLLNGYTTAGQAPPTVPPSRP